MTTELDPGEALVWLDLLRQTLTKPWILRVWTGDAGVLIYPTQSIDSGGHCYYPNVHEVPYTPNLLQAISALKQVYDHLPWTEVERRMAFCRDQDQGFDRDEYEDWLSWHEEDQDDDE